MKPPSNLLSGTFKAAEQDKVRAGSWKPLEDHRASLFTTCRASASLSARKQRNTLVGTSMSTRNAFDRQFAVAIAVAVTLLRQSTEIFKTSLHHRMSSCLCIRKRSSLPVCRRANGALAAKGLLPDR